MLDLDDARLFAGDEAPGGSGQNGTLIQHPASSIQHPVSAAADRSRPPVRHRIPCCFGRSRFGAGIRTAYLLGDAAGPQLRRSCVWLCQRRGLHGSVAAGGRCRCRRSRGGRALRADPLLVAKVFAIRSIRPGFWWALAAGYGYGGRTTVDCVPRDTTQRNWRLAFTLAYPIRANQGLVFSLGSGGNFGAGTDFDTVSLGYQHLWGDPTKQ